MKTFLKTIAHGLEVILVSVMSVGNIVAAIIMLVNLHELVGWEVLVAFILSLFALAAGVSFIWMLGNAVIEDNKEKNEEESK